MRRPKISTYWFCETSYECQAALLVLDYLIVIYCKRQYFTNVRNAAIFPQIVNGGVGELYGESSQSSVCHLLEK